jgi:hypothetical protein
VYAGEILIGAEEYIKNDLIRHILMGSIDGPK